MTARTTQKYWNNFPRFIADGCYFEIKTWSIESNKKQTEEPFRVVTEWNWSERSNKFPAFAEMCQAERSDNHCAGSGEKKKKEKKRSGWLSCGSVLQCHPDLDQEQVADDSWMGGVWRINPSAVRGFQLRSPGTSFILLVFSTEAMKDKTDQIFCS